MHYNLIRLDEITRKDLLAGVDNWTIQKSERLTHGIRYAGITEDYIVVFKIHSADSGNPTWYLNLIQMVEYPDLLDDDSLDDYERTRLALIGELKVSCSCPYFLYGGYQYILTQLDANAIEPENRYPKIRNPKLKGDLCKHSYLALTVFPYYWRDIAGDIAKGRFINEAR